MNEVLSKNELTVEEHVQRIQQCLDKTRQSIFETVNDPSNKSKGYTIKKGRKTKKVVTDLLKKTIG